MLFWKECEDVDYMDMKITYIYLFSRVESFMHALLYSEKDITLQMFEL